MCQEWWDTFHETTSTYSKNTSCDSWNIRDGGIMISKIRTLRVDFEFIRCPEEDVNLWRILLEASQRACCYDGDVADGLEWFSRWCQRDNGASEQTLRLLPVHSFADSAQREREPSCDSSIRKSQTSNECLQTLMLEISGVVLDSPSRRCMHYCPTLFP